MVYGSCEEEYLSAACEHFQELYGIKTTYQRLSTGEVQAKIFFMRLFLQSYFPPERALPLRSVFLL